MTRAFLLTAGLLVAACSNPIGPITDPEYQKHRAACTGGDFQACSDAGHMARSAAGGTANAQAAAARDKIVLSQPIVD